MLWTGKRAGAVVGRKVVFTMSGALTRYKHALDICYKNGVTIGGTTMLGEIQEDLVSNCKMSWDEVEKIEIEHIRAMK